jgi:hypothetical protein
MKIILKLQMMLVAAILLRWSCRHSPRKVAVTMRWYKIRMRKGREIRGGGGDIETLAYIMTDLADLA